ncbi:splicing factor 3A subunit 3, putative [Plasmodium chabaudi chabaudi]|uniref:Splicing factor 3A subunit 3, putative n=1 Tax=Plasmodium chabaudi chabaudi TaxID=31271 RepID=A0A4V6M981_PLACU|nr:splicing factor 3A subunit 3, putative [Plasmodium chabaudi chabaudi]VTZ68467.1 splicing factor 3A subunit 3, putative [Plasmodium chabaudi chabaudi]|eukprot:XP_738455.2 splicing factor 3A subunit 3, putative [Plasmodium chabaudi chabaudi]
MSQFLIEQVRYMHEEIELIEKAIAELIEDKVKNNKKHIFYDYCINYLVEKIQNKSKQLVEIYNDEDNLKKEEMQFISGKTNEDNNDVWKNYYERIKYIKDYHKKTNIKKTEIRSYKSYKNEALKNNKLKSSFSPLEKKGKYIDMTKHYDEFINIKKVKEFRINMFKKKNNLNNPGSGKKKNNNTPSLDDFKEMDLITYLNNFTRFYYIPRYCKYKNDEYKKYLENLLNYLTSFFSKINILGNWEKTYEQYENKFKELFQNKEIKHWECFTYDLNSYCKINDKLYASEGTYQGYLKSKKYDEEFKKYMKKKYSVEELQQIKEEIEKEDELIAKYEYLIENYKILLNKIFQKTIQNIQRKQAFTIEEIEKRQKNEKKIKINDHLLSISDDIINNNNIINNIENILNPNSIISSSDYDTSDLGSEIDDNEGQNDEENEEDENKTIYNPLNLPLGHDNKPIPYWLYKLHGLSKEYKCEICGNYSYFGRAAFEKHFYEWRHSFGMKCLNIPNTLHFKEITKIEDALNLYEKLKKETQTVQFKPDHEVECEDSKGNVMSIKAYDDLKRQGLL